MIGVNGNFGALIHVFDAFSHSIKIQYYQWARIARYTLYYWIKSYLAGPPCSLPFIYRVTDRVSSTLCKWDIDSPFIGGACCFALDATGESFPHRHDTCADTHQCEGDYYCNGVIPTRCRSLYCQTRAPLYNPCVTQL